MEKQNVTLSLPRSLLREAKILAVERETSLSQLLVEALQELVRRRREYERAKKRHRAILRKGFDLGTRGQVQVRREELHERRPNLR
jgi:metal-responsive CopG/Arc/MetJ family transcriptional regulator